MICINVYLQGDKFNVPPGEVTVEFSRAGGPGGQNVNKLNTKAQVRWNVFLTKALSMDQKIILVSKLANRINNAGELLVESSEERTQLNNKNKALERLNFLVSEALIIPKKRRATKPTRASKIKRLESKNKHSRLKKMRLKKIDLV